MVTESLRAFNILSNLVSNQLYEVTIWFCYYSNFAHKDIKGQRGKSNLTKITQLVSHGQDLKVGSGSKDCAFN